jgi:hypothetical protein
MVKLGKALIGSCDGSIMRKSKCFRGILRELRRENTRRSHKILLGGLTHGRQVEGNSCGSIITRRVVTTESGF